MVLRRGSISSHLFLRPLTLVSPVTEEDGGEDEDGHLVSDTINLSRYKKGTTQKKCFSQSGDFLSSG